LLLSLTSTRKIAVGTIKYEINVIIGLVYTKFRECQLIEICILQLDLQLESPRINRVKTIQKIAMATEGVVMNTIASTKKFLIRSNIDFI
jgi:hypothetical protein